ncbi:YceI family protein [Rhodoferax sp. WC2427]|uniref:YceI family protein n=1 Tax=Rhodoferax sp. WC2427 TaxID=3234144 RepID=UPI00346711AD
MRHTLLALAAIATLTMGTAQAEVATYAIDPSHTFVTFEIGHMGTSTNRGRFDKKEGTAQLDIAGKTGKVDLTIDATSLSTGTPAFNKHLMSADFFNVEQYPTLKFSADKFVFNGTKVSEINGTLTLLGKTNPVTLKASNFNCYQSPMLKREVCGGDFAATIQRSQWGMTWGANYGFPDAVQLVVQVEAVKQ